MRRDRCRVFDRGEWVGGGLRSGNGLPGILILLHVCCPFSVFCTVVYDGLAGLSCLSWFSLSQFIGVEVAWKAAAAAATVHGQR